MVRAEHLTFAYRQNDETNYKALSDIHIQIEKGSFTAILGHNGSGKSTLAKHMNALLLPTEGVIWVNNIDTRREEMLWEVRKTAGMVFQNPDNQMIAAVVEEDVAFGPENMGVEPSEIRRRVDTSLDAVGMGAYASRSPAMLSGGQKQRIAIAGIMAMRPELIVLDEPTAMLDPMGRKEVMDTILKLNNEEGITIVLITHFMEEAALADKIFVMDDGKVLMDGDPKMVFAQVETMKQIGLDVPQVTEVAYLLRKKGINIECDILTIDEMVNAVCQLKSGN